MLEKYHDTQLFKTIPYPLLLIQYLMNSSVLIRAVSLQCNGEAMCICVCLLVSALPSLPAGNGHICRRAVLSSAVTTIRHCGHA